MASASAPPPLPSETPRPSPPGFFRLLLRNASQNKQGFGVIVLATSCLFLSMSMLDHKHRFEQLQEQYMSLKKENEDLQKTLGNVTAIISDAAGQAGDDPESIKDSSASVHTKAKAPLMV